MSFDFEALHNLDT
ncbi:hypothetical protein MTR67_039448, partial [Solanum verrucosum]